MRRRSRSAIAARSALLAQSVGRPIVEPEGVPVESHFDLVVIQVGLQLDPKDRAEGAQEVLRLDPALLESVLVHVHDVQLWFFHEATFAPNYQVEKKNMTFFVQLNDGSSG